ncbi:LysR substrate-binding domain-containing protein [Microbispora bryophytorum]|uniref:LysR substrate-binding domain-containing protein n=1 Tax=Microbispora bryophytorum TaxID=1460882 RepID=A0A8H9GX99_9ACTN|nr:LysR substrate-binding domain-containing protein [Microbispora bryophytorum]GGO08818.1 hypothetical protein GCM10011574_23650 [Microbispora bryophytorum]
MQPARRGRHATLLGHHDEHPQFPQFHATHGITPGGSGATRSLTSGPGGSPAPRSGDGPFRARCRPHTGGGDRAGLPLFTRDKRRTALTAAGEQLVADAELVLAGEESLRIADLADEHLLQHPDAVPEWSRVAPEMREPRQVPAGTAERTVEEKLELVTTGRGISILPESTAMYYQRPDVVYVPILDIPPNEVALAWVSGRRDPLVAEFAALAAGMPRPPGVSTPERDGTANGGDRG